jgi:hypothetical protein
VPAFEGTRKGICTGAILRAPIANPSKIEPVAWGFRNPFGLRFSPVDHPLRGELLISENGEDERGARPVNNAPDRIAIARQNPDGSPSFHGLPDRFGFLDSTQSVFNPIGGPGDDLWPDVARIRARTAWCARCSRSRRGRRWRRSRSSPRTSRRWGSTSRQARSCTAW